MASSMVVWLLEDIRVYRAARTLMSKGWKAGEAGILSYEDAVDVGAAAATVMELRIAQDLNSLGGIGGAW